MRFGRVPVYCQTPAGWCIELDVYLGEHVKATKVKCPYCNRFSIAGRSVNNDQGEKSGKGYGKGRLSTV